MLNSKDYWDRRFYTNDWDKKGGKEQTLFFAKIITDNLPDWFIKDVNKRDVEVCDWGCAEGQGAFLFSKLFDKAKVLGIDISQEAIKIAKNLYPSVEFRAMDIEFLDSYDVIISSNTLEHFFHPFNIIEQLSLKTRKYFVFLLPFQEENRIEEHFFTFQYDNIPFFIKDFGLKFFKEIDVSKLDGTYWNGKQILLIYKKDFEYTKMYLSDFGVGDLSKNIDNLNNDLEKISLENRNLMIENEKLITKFEFLSREYNLVVQERDRIKLESGKIKLENKDLKKKNEELVGEFEVLSKKYNRVSNERNEIYNTLNEIYKSDLWTFASWYYRAKDNNLAVKFIVKIARRLKSVIYNIKKKKKSLSNKNLENGVGNADLSKNSLAIKQFNLYYSNLYLPKTKDKYDIFFFSIIDWNFRFQRPQHFATRLANNGHRVFYFKTALGAVSNYSVNEVSRNIYEIELPYVKKSVIYSENFNGDIELTENAIRDLIKQYSIKEHVYFVEFPMWHDLVKKLKESFGMPVIFDMLDEFSDFKNVHKDISIYERKMSELSHSIIASSKKLYDKAKNLSKHSFLIRNGTDFNHFNKIVESEVLNKIKKPIIGYYGAISEWFDTELIEYVAKKHSDWSFVLIGHTFGSDIGKLKKLHNIHFLGEKPYSELPKYLHKFDVCLIPFKDSPLIRSTNPVKFYEYISAGKPVVATKMDELEKFSDIAYLAKDKYDFEKKIELALKEQNNQNIVEKRISIAKTNDWSNRVKYLESAIKNSFDKVSIIIVTYNNLNYTKLCINSILEKTAYPNYEIILVDNNSSDETRDYLKELEKNTTNIKIILNNENFGFAKANNIGIKEAKGEYIILLNNDTVVTRGWIMGLLRHFKDEVGMVGPVTNSIGNEAKINVEYESLDDLDAFAEYYTNKHFGEEFDIKVLAMFCVAIKREVIETVGLLDESYGIGMFEDDDYSMAVKKAGYRLLCVDDVFIHHFGGASFKKLEDKKYMEIFSKNRKKFEKKWNVKWETHKYRKGVK